MFNDSLKSNVYTVQLKKYNVSRLVSFISFRKKSTQNNQHKLAVEHDAQGTECTDSG